jgi:hypothetical protein
MTSSNGGHDAELLTIKAESLIKNAGFVRDILTMKNNDQQEKLPCYNNFCNLL